MSEFKVVESDVFKEWFDSLADLTSRTKILTRIAKMRVGHLGDYKVLSHGVLEIRIVGKGPDYRFYLVRDAADLYPILCGGDKDSQSKDIRLAYHLALERKRQ